MLEVSGEFFRIANLLHVKYSKQFCIISSGVVVGGRRFLFDIYKSMLISIYHKKVINFRNIHYLESMRSIYPH